MVMVIVKYVGIWLSLVAAFIINPSTVLANQAIDFKSNLCHSVAKKTERLSGIPSDLLTSISLAETGRWNPKKKEMFAWPWTVTWGGKGRYFPTKEAAINTVKHLQLSGVKNIDVGCTQINMLYHPNAFNNLDEAFDPESNVDYAGRFLSGLYKSTGSWIQAAANYHSTNPLLNLNYQTKILKIWRKVSGISLNDLPTKPSNNPSYRDPMARVAQMALLDSRFRARLEAERGAKKNVKARNQLEAWRKARNSPNLLSHTAALQKAKQKLRQKSDLNKDQVEFAKKRLQQLAKWRRDRYFFQR